MEKREVTHELVGGLGGYTTKKGKKIVIPGTTRHVLATFPANKCLRRYYWLEGPMRHEPGRRIVVQHKGQKERQCGHCLEWASKCAYQAVTHLCRQEGAYRKPLTKYCKELAEQDGYESLKMMYRGYLDHEDQEADKRGFHDNQVYEYEDLLDEMESEEGRQKEASKSGAAGAKSKLTPTSKTTPTETPTTNPNPEKEAAEKLEKTLAEKEKEIESLKEEQKKTISEMGKLKTENNTIKRDQAIDRKNQIKLIHDNLLQNSLHWNTTRESTSVMAANIIDRNQFVYDKEHDKVAVKEGENPWDNFKLTINLKTPDKSVEERYKDLQNMILKRIKEKNTEKKTRSESTTRSRSEASEEEEQKEELKAKKVKEGQEEKGKKVEEKKVEQMVKQVELVEVHRNLKAATAPVETKAQKKTPTGKNKKKNGF